MNVVIVEDEKPSARKLQRMLSKLGIETNVLLHSIEESLDWFSTHKHPDLIFLDIQLSDGLSFEIFEHIEIKSPVIFTTAYDEYALRAFQLNSVDYLLKPLDPNDLAKAVEKYKARIPSDNELQMNLSEIKKLLMKPVEKEYKTRFSIKVGQHIKLIEVDDIECFFSQDKGIYAHTVDGRNHLMDDTLEQLLEQLDPVKYFRISRKFIINIKAVKDMLAYSNSRLEIKLESYKDQEVVVARERVKEFKSWLEK